MEVKEFSEMKEAFVKMSGKLELAREQKGELQLSLERERGRLNNFMEARSIIQGVALSTQRNLEYHISNLVTMAIMAIDSSWPKFVARIEIQRNKTECNLFFSENGIEQRPKDCSGGGVKDVASFALRAAYWSLRKNRRTFILDEPFRNVSPDLQSKTSEMVKMISEELDLQIIMVSHQEEINIAANKTFLVTKIGQISKVEEIN